MVDGAAEVILEIEQPGYDLQVGLHLPERPGSSTDVAQPWSLVEHPGVEGVDRALTRGQAVWAGLVQGEATHSVVEQDSRVPGHHPVATVKAVDVGDDHALLVYHAQVGGVGMANQLRFDGGGRAAAVQALCQPAAA